MHLGLGGNFRSKIKHQKSTIIVKESVHSDVNNMPI